jgi:glycosyltransferase involved in cell wall biosynthesis
MKPTISVIVITYNQEGTIGRTLDSILMQQCHVPYEIVIGEDCSTDTTLAVCQQYADQHPGIIRILANKENKGPANNYFDCMLQCRGEYIADCAGDDFWCDPRKLEKEVSILEFNPDVTLVHTAWNNYHVNSGLTTDSNSQPFTAPITKGIEMLEDIIIQTRIPVIHLCTSLYRKSIVLAELEKDEFMFRNKEFGCEDLQVAFIMAQQGNIAYLPERTLNYSVGGETISSPTNHHQLFLFTKRVSSLSYYLSQKYNLHSPRIGNYFCHRIYELGMHAFRAHDKQLFYETLQYEEEWKVRRTNKVAIVFFVMRHKWIWALALQVRSAFVTLKRLFR